MAVFKYKGLSASGRSIAGTIEAASEKGALDLLTGDGIIPTAIETGAAGARGLGLSAIFGARIPLVSRTLFVRELATFLHADVPLLEALDVLRTQEENPAFQKILDDVHHRVQSGDSFSKALSNHPKIFSQLLVSMVRVGETGGMLASVLEQMATWMEHEEEIRGEVRAALAYPIMILVLGIVTVFILLSFVLPRITEIFAGMEANLPLPTKILMGSADFMAKWWWAAPFVVGGLYVLYDQFSRTPRGRSFLDHAALSAPIFGSLATKTAVARFARASAALLSSGVPLLETLHVVRGLLGNVAMSQMVDDAIERVTRGQPLARTLGESSYFPASAIHLLSVGERTGRLSEMFERVAATFEKQSRSHMKILLNLLSPLMIVALAILVALIAISILLPIFQMNRMMR